ncbi:hypothetical protein BH23ACT9_BH23ACT9_04220 [soil metagenome]
MTRHTLTAVVIAVLLLAGCGDADDTAASTPTSSPTATATATDPATDPTPTEEPDVAASPSTVSTTLGLVEVEGGCVVIDVDGVQHQLIAAPDADVVIDSGNGVVADTSGTVIARVGDPIVVAGAVDPGMMTFCQVGPVFVADSVTAG